MVAGLACWQLALYEQGLEYMNHVSVDRVRSVDFFGLLGMLCRRVPGHSKRAEEAYKLALEIDPKRSDIHYNLANLIREYNPKDALIHYINSIRLDPLASNVWHNYGAALNEESLSEVSVEALGISLMLDPTDADAWCNLGLAMFQLEKFDASKRCFVHSIGLDQCHASSHIKYGQVLIETLQPEEALQVLRRGVELDSSSSNSLWNLSLALLLLGQYKDGWRYYEARFHTDEFGKAKPPTAVKLPLNQEALPCQGETELIVWSEQGIGDGIQFCRYLHLLEAKQVPYRFLAHKPLVSLYRDWMGLGEKVSVALGDDSSKNDLRPSVSLLSLPHLFGTELHNVPSVTPYLKPPCPPPPHLSISKPPGGLSVGIVWASNPVNKVMYKHKSLPASHLLPPLINLVNLDLIELHSLQVGDDSSQLEPWLDNPRLTDWNGLLNDFSDTAHVVQQLDLVISVDTAVAHLAGALNCPTWLLLPYNADFRWLHKRSDSPWYPSMRLFRQPVRGDWSSLIPLLQQALDELFLLDLSSLSNTKLNS